MVKFAWDYNWSSAACQAVAAENGPLKLNLTCLPRETWGAG
jgi:hypothetical protein